MKSKNKSNNNNIYFSPLIHKNCDFLHNFHAKCRSKRTQRGIIERASDEQLLCFVEACFNILKGRVPLQRRHLLRLGAMKHVLRRLARARSARTTRKLLLTGGVGGGGGKLQKGSGLPAVAGVLASILVPLVVDSLRGGERGKT